MNELERLEKVLDFLKEVNVKVDETEYQSYMMFSIARSLAIIADKMKEKDVKL